MLMAEIVRLRQQQQGTRDKVILMEERIRSTERKQQQMMSFLAKALTTPSFVQQYIDKYVKKREERHIEIGRKRRLTMSPSAENLQEEVVSLATGNGQIFNYSSQEREELNIESEMETFFSAALDNESSSDIKYPNESGNNFDPVSETIWEELFAAEDAIAGDEEGEVVVGDHSEAEVEVEDLVAEPQDWGEDLQDLVDQMGFLRSIP